MQVAGTRLSQILRKCPIFCDVDWFSKKSGAFAQFLSNCVPFASVFAFCVRIRREQLGSQSRPDAKIRGTCLGEPWVLHHMIFENLD